MNGIVRLDDDRPKTVAGILDIPVEDKPKPAQRRVDRESGVGAVNFILAVFGCAIEQWDEAGWMAEVEDGRYGSEE